MSMPANFMCVSSGCAVGTVASVHPDPFIRPAAPGPSPRPRDTACRKGLQSFPAIDAALRRPEGASRRSPSEASPVELLAPMVLGFLLLGFLVLVAFGGVLANVGGEQ